jgi:hypothetical protein
MPAFAGMTALMVLSNITTQSQKVVGGILKSEKIPLNLPLGKGDLMESTYFHVFVAPPQRHGN